jgi:nucleotide-binding universal stress UspA family protein
MVFKRILAAIDHSPLSQSVFEQALDLAKSNQANLMLFHCLTIDTIAGAPQFSAELGLSPHFLTQTYQAQQVYVEQQSREIKALLQRYCETATQQGVTAEFDYQITDPGQGLCQIAQSWRADLVVLGRRGRKGFTEVLLGSVSNYVLHHAPCAVLVIQTELHTAAPATTTETTSTAEV